MLFLIESLNSGQAETFYTSAGCHMRRVKSVLEKDNVTGEQDKLRNEYLSLT